MTDAKVIMVKRDYFTEKMLDYDLCTIPCTPKAKDMTKAKQLLLESSLIAKDMEILLLKEKLEDANNDIELLKSDKIVLQSDNKYLFKRCEDHAHQKLEYACALSEEKRKHASNYNLLIEANKELDKMPNWIKWLFK